MKTLKQMTLMAVMAAVLGPVALTAHAQQSQGTEAAKAGTAQAALSDGEVRKIDVSAGKITIKHGPLANLEMGPMTMVFRVKDPAMLTQVKEGDKIRFIAERVGGALTVTTLQVEK